MQYIAPQDLKSFGLIPEIIGRLPILTYLNPLDRNALRSILTEPKNSIIKQYVKLFKMDKIELVSPNDQMMERVMKVINENISSPDLSVEFIADKIGISRVHFHRRLKDATGLTPRDFVRNIRLSQAAKLLAGKNFDITDVAIATGFRSVSTFLSLIHI